jgi:hypothetical protein
VNTLHHEHSWSRWHDADATFRFIGSVELFQVRGCQTLACGLIESRSIPQVLA